jgi:hypothetical protein
MLRVVLLSFMLSLQINQLSLAHTWSNFTFDSMAVENLAPGDAKSAELARPLSVSSANNMWPLYYNRSQDRLLLKNVTFVVGSQVGTCGSSCALKSDSLMLLQMQKSDSVMLLQMQKTRHVRV